MKDLFFAGSTHKIEGPLGLQDVFKLLTGQIFQRMFQTLQNLAPEEFPYSEYLTSNPDEDREEGVRIEDGVQLTIEADCFGRDFIYLRRHANGYTVVMTSDNSENMGSMEYEFVESDELVKLIPQNVQEEMERLLYDFDPDDDSIEELKL